MREPNLEKSLSAADVPQRLVVSHVWDLPFGRGRDYGKNWPGVVDKVLGGWQLSGIMTLANGFPLPISQTPGQLFALFGTQRPNLVATPTQSSGSRANRINQWLGNPTSAFTQAAPFTYGTAPRILPIRADGIKNYDFSIVKFIPIWESFNAEFRGDFFNGFNRPQFSAPNMTFGSATFGRVTSTYNQSRLVQLVLRLNW